ncbi:DUF2461 domain-containing protein [Sphingobacterium sp. SRCM116780]|uniref:DUF2461 domain-containing protein n=1 Tax=Sphingobacterium sp. SRCM116780 TaxID=2907623 RepID=UPI001F15BB93|nr:DUF2461 domain-containing protein [Sphingobacterium sp. SRCM116780]UIR55760.1 DUF2461 domain-containing protein [Sphingobacterium sp. SRCM116780]
MGHLNQNTFTFLKDLQDNNSREWFAEQKDRYEAALADVRQLVAELITALSQFDPHIPADIQPNKCLFRIYRDTRFSKDKTPYKNWFGAGISVDGRKLDGPEYYIHISPENSFIACGYWRPEKMHLDAIRQEIDYNTERFNTIVQDLQDNKGLSLETEDKLKRPPVGYDAEHVAIEFLKLKSFVTHQALSNKELTSKDAMDNIIASYKTMLPLKQFLHEAIDND